MSTTKEEDVCIHVPNAEVWDNQKQCWVEQDYFVGKLIEEGKQGMVPGKSEKIYMKYFEDFESYRKYYDVKVINDECLGYLVFLHKEGYAG